MDVPVKIKPWWESTTIWLAVAQGVAGVLAALFAADPALKTTGAGAVIKSIYDIYLRFNTASVLSSSSTN